MKKIIKIVLLVSILSSSAFGAKEFSGVWATECGNNSNNPATLQIIRTSADGLYQVGRPGIKMFKPSPIIGAKDFKIINKDTIVYNNITYKRCSKTATPKYNPLSEDHIKKYLQGEWKFKYQSFGGRKKNISNGRSEVPDLNFINADRATINLKNDIRPVNYELDEDKLSLKLEEWKTMKVLLVNDKELQLTFEMKPSQGVFIYYKNKRK